MSLASPRTANNQAEYLGLVTGLAAADRHRWPPLSVVGDSQLIITQLRCFRPPKNTVLWRVYHSARRLADGLGITHWSHHLRAFNKAADAAANIVMDTRRSIQTHHPTDRPEWVGLAYLSAANCLHWRPPYPETFKDTQQQQDESVAGLPHFDVFWTALRSDNPPAAPVDVEARLYFDGGARGNPGIAGSGSVIVERTTGDDCWNIVWWKATYLGDSHTNTTAEHAAIHDGLVECAARYREQNVRVLIVGDSHLVLSQLLGTARCKTPHLRCLQEQSSLLLRTLTTAQVRHTLRDGNTMADYLANMAMNTKNSHRSDSNWTPTDEHLTRMLPDDTAHPHTDVTVKSTVDLLERTRRHIQHYEADDASASGLKPA